MKPGTALARTASTGPGRVLLVAEKDQLAASFKSLKPLEDEIGQAVEGRNEKPKIHSGGNRGLSYNMFLLAKMGG